MQCRQYGEQEGSYSLIACGCSVDTEESRMTGRQCKHHTGIGKRVQCD